MHRWHRFAICCVALLSASAPLRGQDATVPTAPAVRTEPWPLREYPPPGYWQRQKRCEPGEGLPVRMGEARLRLFSVEVLAPPVDDQHRTRLLRYRQLLQEWGALRPASRRCRIPARWNEAPDIESTFTIFYRAPFYRLDGRCVQQGRPGVVLPQCDRPDDVFWWQAYVRGMPWLIQINRARRPLADHRQINGFYTAAVERGPVRLEDRPGGGQTVVDGQGRTAGLLLPRIGDIAETGAPIFVACGLGFHWLDMGTQCSVRYRHRGLLDVGYRFYREIFDEPDIPALDLRVQQLVQTMLDGAEVLPPDWRQ